MSTETDMGGSNKKIFEGMKYIQRAWLGYECLEDDDSCTWTMI
jgi:hypothetical protein